MEREYFLIGPNRPEKIGECWYLPDEVKDDNINFKQKKSVLIYRKRTLFAKAKYLPCLFFYKEDSRCYEFFTGIYLGVMGYTVSDNTLFPDHIKSEEFGFITGNLQARNAVIFQQDIQPHIEDKEFVIQRIKDILNQRSIDVKKSHREEQEKQQANDAAFREANDFLTAFSGAPKR